MLHFPIRPLLPYAWSAKRRSMAAEVIMPQMGESIAEGTITKWLKKVGRSGQAGRADLRDLDGQSGRRDPLAGRRDAARDQGCRRPDRGHQYRGRVDRRSGRESRGGTGRRGPCSETGRSAGSGSRGSGGARPSGEGSRAPARAGGSRSPAVACGSSPAAGRVQGTVESFEERIRQRSSPLVRKIA